MHKLLTVLLCSTLLLALTSDPAHSQDEAAHPLLQMLALTPDDATFVTYTDYDATESAGLTPLEIDNFQADVLDDAAEGRAWARRSLRLRAGLELSFVFTGAADMPTVVGFDFADIARVVTFNQPPAQGLVLQGAFDEAAVRATHLARDYVETDVNGVPALCNTTACDDGLDPSLLNRNLSNIFDPALGRKPPVLLLDGTLVSAFALDVVSDLADVAQGTTTSLADSAPHTAIANALTDPTQFETELVQVLYFTAADVQTVPSDALLRFDTRAAYEDASEIDPVNRALLDGVLASDPLPAYELMAFADMHDGTEQFAVVALAYADAETAQGAAAVLTERLRTFADPALGPDAPPLLQGFAMPTMLGAPSVHVDDATGRAVALVTVTYPLLPDDAELSPGLIFIGWYNAVLRATFYPLWTLDRPAWAVKD